MSSSAEDGSGDIYGGLITDIAEKADREAFSRLFDHFAPRIKGFLMRGGASADIAEDLAQEALLTVWRKASYYDPSRASASTWIFTIVRNLRIDGQRRQQRAALYATAVPEEEEPPMQPDEALLLSQRQARVREALKELPADQMDVVKMSFVEGRAHGEIAEKLNIPLGTVKSRMRLAMVKLKGMLEELA